MKILVTGGAGFIGTNLVNRLAKENHEIVIFDNLSTGRNENLAALEKHGNVKFQQGDIRNVHDLEKLFKTRFDTVFHLSAIVGVSNYMADPLKVVDVNVMGTKNILEHCIKQDSKFIFMSTSEIYGKNPKVPWKEEDDRVLGNPQISRWSYSTSKAVCEHMISALTKEKKIQSVILRYFNIYGPWQNNNFVVSRTIYNSMNGIKPTLYDSGNQTRCFTFVGDAMDATIKAVFDDSINDEVFNIGNSVETTIKEAIKTILEETQKPTDFVDYVKTNEKFGAAYEDITRRVPDVSKAKRLLGWEAKTQLREGVKSTIQWIKENPWWLQ
ncbi:MAG: NAD-dependent epimerase/dehydratase family protein [Nitrosopumilaceae archaeon]